MTSEQIMCPLCGKNTLYGQMVGQTTKVEKSAMIKIQKIVSCENKDCFLNGFEFEYQGNTLQYLSNQIARIKQEVFDEFDSLSLKCNECGFPHIYCGEYANLKKKHGVE